MEIQRYKVGYYTDEWGMSSNTPCLIKSDTGYAVKYEDFAKSAVEIQTLRRERDELLAALEYHQAQTRPIQATMDVIASLKESK